MENQKVLFVFSLFLMLFIFIGTSVFLPNSAENLSFEAKNYLAGVFFEDSVDSVDLRDRYELAISGDKGDRKKRSRKGLRNDKPKILIVPGHDAQTVGSAFGSVKEVELNWQLGQELYTLLDKEEGVHVMLAGTSSGFNPTLQKYFDENRMEILEYRNERTKIMNDLVAKGEVTIDNDGVFHNNAPSETVIQLYGINKWVNENKFDIVIHIHFNDYPRKNRYSIGKYSGFSIYVPEEQYSNSEASFEMAEEVFDRLSILFPQSNLPVESAGIIEDQDLIAIGAKNTVDAISILVEYGYIYESVFSKPNLKDVVLKEMAFQTAQGVKQFLDGNGKEYPKTLVLPNIWNNNLGSGLKGSEEVLALQALLKLEGHYPPKGRDAYSCPITGNFGPCTQSALKSFQTKNNINPTGFTDLLTRDKLNSRL
jgi:N-acetylmuramoyl-L-alanine amidase